MTDMRIACVGGGPGGLLVSLLVKRLRPEWEVVLLERNRPADAFGFGVVFSDATLRALDEVDPELRVALADEGVHWTAIDVLARSERERFDGNGMAAIRRSTLLSLLQAAARRAGVDLRFEHPVSGLDELAGFDLVIAADGANSTLRRGVAESLGQTVDVASAKFIWFGTTHLFDGLTFVHERSEHGSFAVHGYPISGDTSTFIVETDEETWRRARLDEFDVTQPPGASDEKSRAYLQRLFAPHIGDAPLLVNNSRWANFATRRTARWHEGTLVFLGDAVHTAHFSVGSGTKMAMEDAISLAHAITSGDPLEAALERYEHERQPAVARIQDAAVPSLAWWERFGDYWERFAPWQFAFHFFSRSIPLAKIRQRDAAYAEHVEAAWAREHGAAVRDAPLTVAGGGVAGRILTRRGENGVDPRGGVLDLALGVAVDAAHPRSVPAGAAFAVVHGGTATQRANVAERTRLDDGMIAVVVDPDADVDLAETLVLSGRADAVVVGAP